MSLLPLLVVASVVAALAFFMAGWLLRRPGPRLPTQAQTDQVLALQSELCTRQTEQQKAIAALAEARRQRDLEAEARAHAESARDLAEQERKRLQGEHDRQAAREKSLADRLRAAEDGARAALEQIETNAAAWNAQCHAAKVERDQREANLRRELEAERQGREDGLRRERDELRARAEAATKACQASELRERKLHGELEHTVAEWQEKLSRAEARWQAALVQEQNASQALCTEREVDARAALASERSAWQDKLTMAQAEWRSQRAAIEREREGALAALAAENEQNQRLALALQTAEETLGAERAHAQAVSDALRSAETRLHEVDALIRENLELRDEHARIVGQAKDEAAREADAKDARVELAAAQAKLVELEQVLEENRKLRDEVAELRSQQADAGELERLAAAHKQLRLDAELMARRLQELQNEQAELVPLRAQAAEAASLLEEVSYLRRREKDLEAQLYASGFYASREMPAVSGETFIQTPVTNMETNLDSLVGDGGPRTAVLADAQGFLIAGAGESFAQEGLAAFAAVATDLVSRARMLLPLAEVRSVRVADANSMILTCHLFDSDGQGLGVATLGPGEAAADKTQHAIVELAAIVSTGGDADSGAIVALPQAELDSSALR